MTNYIEQTRFEKSLTDAEANLCDGHITRDECENAIHKMKLNKSPGLDGLTVEFYQIFWQDICDILTNVYNESFHQGELSLSQRKSILSLFFKKNDKEKLENYRPISLSNVDYKLLAHALSNRLKCVLNKSISFDQTDS